MFPSQRRSSGVWNQERGSAGPCLVSCLSCRQARGGRQDRRAGRQRGGEDLGRTRGRRWHRAQREKPGGHGKDWEIALGSHGAQWGRILTAGRAGDLGVCCTWATGDWLGCWGERATGWDVWKNNLEADHREDGVTEARQRVQSCVLARSCGHYVKQARWVAESSSGFCKCSWWWPEENQPHYSSRSLLLWAREGDQRLSPQSRCFGNYCQCQVPPQVIDPQLCETNIISFTVMKLPGEGWGLSGSKWGLGVGIGGHRWAGQEEFGVGEQAKGPYNQAS